MVTEMTQAQNDTKEIYVAIITEFNLNFLQHCKLVLEQLNTARS